MWLQKDEYDATHRGEKDPGSVCLYPVHSLKERRILETSGPTNSLKTTTPTTTTSFRNLSEMCVTGTSVTGMTSVKYFKSSTPPVESPPAVLNDSAESGSNGGVRSILNILDSFKIGPASSKESPEAPANAEVAESGESISVVESNVQSSKESTPNSKSDAATTEVNRECMIINGMSQGDRLQQIKSLRRQHHARATTTGALKLVYFIYSFKFYQSILTYLIFTKGTEMT